MLPTGKRIAIDIGAARTGVAITDASVILASPLKTLLSAEALLEITQIILDEAISVVYIGLPIHLSGRESESSNQVRDFAAQLRSVVAKDVAIHLVDERLSTKSAIEKNLSANRAYDRNTIDQLAAVEILEFAMKIEESTGQLAGHEI
jgi:putative Holliday junction resolvase